MAIFFQVPTVYLRSSNNWILIKSADCDNKYRLDPTLIVQRPSLDHVNGEIVVDQASNTTLSFIDSGAPSAGSYETIILVHGNSFGDSLYR